MDFYKHKVVAPIKQMHFDYHRPLRYRESMTIEAIWHWSEAARINYEFIILDPNGQLATTGYTVQMMLDFERGLWSFKVSRATLTGIDNSDGVDICLGIGDSLSCTVRELF